MSSQLTDKSNRVEETFDPNPLMEAFNPRPLEAAQPDRFYWQETWREASADACVQAAFEN